ncbi:MAG: hypothetical protein WBQ95_10515 [Terracidiphilus sp.]
MYSKRISLVMIAMWASIALCCYGQTPAGWHTYHNPDYGFSIAYPASFTLTYTSSVVAGSVKETGNDLDHPGYGCQPTSLVCFEYKQPTFSRAGIFGIGVTVNLHESSTEVECHQLDEGDHLADMTKTARINGIAFHSGDTSEGWTVHSVGMTKYRVFRRNVCFEIETAEGMYDFAPEEDDYHAPDARVLHRIHRDQESIVHSFAFTDPRSRRLRP